MWWKCYVHMHENGKLDLLKLFQEWGENDGGGEFSYGTL
jgi:hypothetical protein